jgi:hypothetical protein
MIFRTIGSCLNIAFGNFLFIVDIQHCQIAHKNITNLISGFLLSLASLTKKTLCIVKIIFTLLHFCSKINKNHSYGLHRVKNTNEYLHLISYRCKDNLYWINIECLQMTDLSVFYKLGTVVIVWYSGFLHQ